MYLINSVCSLHYFFRVISTTALCALMCYGSIRRVFPFNFILLAVFVSVQSTYAKTNGSLEKNNATVNKTVRFLTMQAHLISAGYRRIIKFIIIYQYIYIFNIT